MLRRRPFLGCALLALLVTTTACSDDAGELVLIMQTDLSLPKDVDAVRVEVFNNDVQKFKNDYERLGTDNQPFRLPGTLTLQGSDEPTDAVRLVLSARRGGKDGSLRIVREVVTTVPEKRTAALHVPLNFLCDGQGTFDTSGEVTSDCPESGHTCIAGSCQPAAIDPATLPDYTSAGVYVPGQCLDVRVCFDAGTPAVVDTGDCSIDAAPDSNVAIEAEGDGICGARGCFVALEAESVLGWQTREDGRLQLPPAVCQQIDSGKLVGVVTAPASETCPLRVRSVPSCGPWSAAGEHQTEGGPVVLAGGQDAPAALAVANDVLFWSNAGEVAGAGSVKAVDVMGGPPLQLQGNVPPAGDMLALASGDIVWTLADEGAGNGSIQLFDPGPDSTPSALVTALEMPAGLAARGDFIYWTQGVEMGGIWRASLSSPDPQLLAPAAYPSSLAADDSHLYWTTQVTPGAMMPDGAVQRCPIGGGAVESVATGLANPRTLIVDAANTGNAAAVYWTTFSDTDGAVMRATISGGSTGTPEVVVAGLPQPYGLALDATHLYWTNWGDGTIMRVPRDAAGATGELVVGDQRNPGAIQLDDTSLYWINQSQPGQRDGTLMHAPKP